MPALVVSSAAATAHSGILRGVNTYLMGLENPFKLHYQLLFFSLNQLAYLL